MANELRKRQLGIGGLVEDNPLGSTATLLTSGGLAAITGGVGSTEHMAIVFNPDGEGLPPEIAYLTDVTAGAGATGATGLIRGQEGTTQQQWAQDTPWVHALTLRDQVQHKSTVYAGSGSDLTTTSSSFVDIDATNLPALSSYLFVGDEVELLLTAAGGMSSAGNVAGFDWLVDRPVSADTNLRGSAFAAWLFEGANVQSDGTPIAAHGLFVATEEGVHTFKPQWKISGGTTLHIFLSGTYWQPIVHTMKNLGPRSA